MQAQLQNEAVRNPFIRMPKVHQMAGIDELFAEARRTAAENERDGGRHVVVVTPERKFFVIPCPAPGSMATEKVIPMEQSFKHGKGGNIAVIAYNEFQHKDTATMRELAEKIPFFGLLLGFAYVGQNVYIFEGHSSAFAAGCRDADVLIVDGGMIPFLQKDWKSVAVGAMRHPEIHVHDRKTYSLQRITGLQNAVPAQHSKKTKVFGMETWELAVVGILALIVLGVVIAGIALMLNNGVL